MSLLKEQPAAIELCIFLMTDAVFCALPNQITPQGFYNIERMLKFVIANGAIVKACGFCSEARGIDGLDLTEGIEISNMNQLTSWTLESDRIISF